mmetsp:Transcript_12389/g.35962  ORF Transcript_12389/g.35962 Transcript_12389/m.35962 type:complete len:248 (-) Transcript_12389:3347-4090(-)
MKHAKLLALNLTVDENTLSIHTSFTDSRMARPLFSSVSLESSAFVGCRNRVPSASRSTGRVFAFFGVADDDNVVVSLLSCKNDSSASNPEADILILAIFEMHCKTEPQLSSRYSPSWTAMLSSVSMAAMFLCFISLMEPRNVKLASELMNVSRARDIPPCAAMRMAYTNPFRQTDVLRTSLENSSTCDRIPIIGPHVTSNIGLTTSAGETLSVSMSLLPVPLAAARDLAGRRRISCSVAASISSRSF